MIIGHRPVGQDHPPFIIAEMSANHNGSLDRALAIVDAAANAGADAVKIQLYDPIKLAEARGGQRKVIECGPWSGRTLLSIYAEGAMPTIWLPRLIERAKWRGLILFPSVFDPEDVAALDDQFDFPAYKIASAEIGNLDLIAAADATNKPVILSTGMADETDIRRAANAASYPNLAILHCVSEYPAAIEEANLGRMRYFGSRYNFDCFGLSDHTLGSICPVVATALGASIIEKHLTLRRADGGLDSTFSMEPSEFEEMVCNVTDAWLSMRPVQPRNTYLSLKQKGSNHVSQ